MSKPKTLWYINPKRNQKLYPIIEIIKFIFIITFPIVAIILKKNNTFDNIGTGWYIFLSCLLGLVYILIILFMFSPIENLFRVKIDGNMGMCNCGYFYQPDDISYLNGDITYRKYSNNSDISERYEDYKKYTLYCSCPICGQHYSKEYKQTVYSHYSSTSGNTVTTDNRKYSEEFDNSYEIQEAQEKKRNEILKYEQKGWCRKNDLHWCSSIK